MYLVREIMHCKPGKVGEMIKRFKAMQPLMKEVGMTEPARIVTDMAGGEPFWTLVWEQETPTLEKYLDLTRQTMGDARVQKIMEGYHDFVEGGRREIYKVE